MRNFFSPDSKILNAFGRIVDVVYLSFLWVLFSIPLVTAGAATTALYYTINKTVRHERGHVFHEFWNSFKANFKQSTIIWLLFAAFLIFLRADLKAFEFLGWGEIKVLIYIVQAMGIVAILILLYALCYTARFTQKLGRILLNSLIMALANFPRTVLLLLICLLAALMIYISPFLIILTPGVVGLLTNLVLEKVFVKYMSEEDREMERQLNAKITDE